MKKNKGSTMVEVLAGFVILMILMASAIGIIKVSSNMVMSSKDIEDEQIEFERHIYSNNSSGRLNVSEPVGGISLIETDYQGVSKGTVEIPLEGALIKKYTDEETGMSAYNIVFDSNGSGN